MTLLIRHILCFLLKKLKLHHVLEATIILRQVYLVAAFHVVDTTSQCHAANLPDFIHKVLFQCVSGARFVREQSFLKKTTRKEIKKK